MRENNRKPNCVFPRLVKQRCLCAQFAVHKFCIKGVELPEIIKGFFVGIEPKRQTPLANLVGFGKLIFPIWKLRIRQVGYFLSSASAIEKSSEKSATYKTAFVLSILSIMSFRTIQSSEMYGLGTLEIPFTIRLCFIGSPHQPLFRVSVSLPCFR